MKFNDMVPYIYGITANINFILSQIFFKMLTVVIPPSVVLSFQAFFHLIFNTFIIVSNKKYRATYERYNYIHSITQYNKFQRISIQDQQRIEINIKDPVIFRLVLSRLSFNVMAIWLIGLAIQSIPLSIVNALINTMPIMIFFIEAIYYNVIFFLNKKPLNKMHFILTVISFCGVLMIVDPFRAFANSQKKQLFHMLLPLIACLLSSFGFIYLHQLKGKINHFIAMQYGFISQTLFFHFMTNFVADDAIILQSVEPSAKYFQPSILDPYCVISFVLMIIFSFLAQFFRIKSLYRLKPSKITPFNYIGIVLSILIDTTIFGHKSSFMEIIGILLTSVGLLSHFILALKQGKQNDNQD